MSSSKNNATYLFEIINDFLTFFESDQILAQCDPLEMFYSPILFGETELVHGESAPDALRKAIRKLVKENYRKGQKSDKLKVSPMSMSSSQNSGVFLLKLTQNEKVKHVIFNITFSARGLHTIVETNCKLPKKASEAQVLELTKKIKAKSDKDESSLSRSGGEQNSAGKVDVENARAASPILPENLKKNPKNQHKKKKPSLHTISSADLNASDA